MIVPRGGKVLVARVQAEARVPVLAHLDGINHLYVHSSADPAKAEAIVVNAKMRRTGICGALETLLIDAAYPGTRDLLRSEEHTSELQSLMRISYAVFCLKKKKNNKHTKHT